MANETKHTPLPWGINKKVKTSIEQLIAGQGMNLICQCEDPDGMRTLAEDEANARLIVTACNSHYELLEALKFALPYLEEQLNERITTNASLGNLADAVRLSRSALIKAGLTDSPPFEPYDRELSGE